VPAVVADHALRFPGGAGGVEDVERIGRRDRHTLGRFRARDGIGPGQVVLPQREGVLRALQDHPVVRLVGGGVDRGVQHRLIRHDAGRLQTA
jgi:hypothetical protein